ncbi:MAG: ribonuclease Z [Lactobacillaceae bacterium]|jgi:ribonuclease Z|nr:ribonuclease Z [Lactobacillaceae bacterium]
MEIQFLGTSAGQPTKFRNTSAIALKMLNEFNEVWLFDVGEATQHQILKSDIRSRKVTKVFLSHLHGDHVFGLPGFLASRNFQGSENDEGGVPTDLKIYAPRAVKDFVNAALRMGYAKLDYKLHFVELHPGVIFENDKMKVTAFEMNHNLPTFGFRIEEKNGEGELQIDELLKLGVKPGPILGQIKSGAVVTLDDGTRINGKDFVLKRDGRIITYIPDTKFTPNILEAAKNADLLIHEATYDASEAKIAKKHNHSTNIQAAQNAKDADAKELVLTHLSARYMGKSASEMLREQAAEIFPNVSVARDFTEISIPQKKAHK